MLKELYADRLAASVEIILIMNGRRWGLHPRNLNHETDVSSQPLFQHKPSDRERIQLRSKTILAALRDDVPIKARSGARQDSSRCGSTWRSPGGGPPPMTRCGGDFGSSGLPRTLPRRTSLCDNLALACSLNLQNLVKVRFLGSNTRHWEPKDLLARNRPLKDRRKIYFQALPAA